MTKLFESKPFIIAEVGSNWRTLSDCVESIGKAKACGADAVKFQAFNHIALYGVPYPQTDVEEFTARTGGEYVEVPGYRITEMAHALPLEWLPKLKEKADACGIEFMCTAFSPELVAAVDPFVSVHKVASSDLSYPQLLEAVAKTGKPVLLSTGASSRGDVEIALQYLDRTKTVLMYCNASYPSTHHNLFQMDRMREMWGPYVGLSDHSLDVVYAPLAAVKHHGAIVIEKHFNAFDDLITPDSPHSLGCDDFKIMCDHLRGEVDTSAFNPSRQERDMFLRHNRRLIATRDIAPGEELKFGVNYGAYRSLFDEGHGISPFFWNHEKGPEGKEASKAIARGAGIGPGDFNG